MLVAKRFESITLTISVMAVDADDDVVVIKNGYQSRALIEKDAQSLRPKAITGEARCEETPSSRFFKLIDRLRDHQVVVLLEFDEIRVGKAMRQIGLLLTFPGTFDHPSGGDCV